jgi:hypothetical protein
VRPQQRGLALPQPPAFLGRPRLVFQGELDLDELAARVPFLHEEVGIRGVGRPVVGVLGQGLFQGFPQGRHVHLLARKGGGDLGVTLARSGR